MFSKFQRVFSLAVIVLTMSMVLAAQQNQNDDFEIVEAGQKTAPKSVVTPKESTPVKAAVDNTAKPKTPVVTKTPVVKNSKKNAAEIQNAQSAATGALPLRVEVSDNQPTAQITMAVGAATRYYCEEKPTRLVIGNLEDIGVTKAGTNGFYLRPVNGGVTTNMFIEFASGATVMVNLKTVSPKVLKPGDYNSEVFVKTSAVRDEVGKLRKESEIFKTENAGLKAQVSKLSVEMQSERLKSDAKISEEELWKVIEASAPNAKTGNSPIKGMQIDKLRMEVLTPVYEVRQGTAFLFLSAENKGKAEVLISSIMLLDAKGAVKSSVDELRVAPDKQLRFGLKLNIEQMEKSPARIRFGTSDGKFGEIVLTGFNPSQQN